VKTNCSASVRLHECVDCLKPMQCWLSRQMMSIINSALSDNVYQRCTNAVILASASADLRRRPYFSIAYCCISDKSVGIWKWRISELRIVTSRIATVLLAMWLYFTFNDFTLLRLNNTTKAAVTLSGHMTFEPNAVITSATRLQHNSATRS